MSITTGVDADTAWPTCTYCPVSMFVSRSVEVLPPGVMVTTGYVRNVPPTCSEEVPENVACASAP